MIDKLQKFVNDDDLEYYEVNDADPQEGMVVVLYADALARENQLLKALDKFLPIIQSIGPHVDAEEIETLVQEMRRTQ